jgi:hypothetical protein
MKVETYRLARAIAVGLAAAALGTPSAVADPWGSDAQQQQTEAPALLSEHGLGQNTTQALAAVQPSAVTIVEPGAFDWGDAGVGAAGAFGLTLLASGLLIVSRHGRRRVA